MDISFYNYNGMNNVLQKTLSPVATITDVNPFQPLSPLTGELILNYNANIFAANYCTFLGKSYFVTDRKMLPGQRMSIFCRVDVLQTYSAGIKTAPLIPSRSSDQYNSWIFDAQLPFEEAATSYSLPPVGQAGVDYAVWDYDNMSLIVGAVGASVWEAIEPWQT